MAEKEQKDNLKGLKAFVYKLLVHNFPPDIKIGHIVFCEDFEWLDEQGIDHFAKFVVDMIEPQLEFDHQIDWIYTISLYDNPFKDKLVSKIVDRYSLRPIENKNIEE